MTKKSRAGWVFRIEIITDKPNILTRKMMERMADALQKVEGVTGMFIEEIFEDLKSFKQKAKP